LIAAEPARWDALAARYDSAYDDPGRRGRLVRARLAATLSLLPGERGKALDAGMGGGRLVEALELAGWEVTGIDLSEAMVGLARQRVPGLRDSLLVAPVEHLPFADGAFDAVTALGVLEFTEDVSVAIAELARVLRRGGDAVVSWPNFASLYAVWRRGMVGPLARALGRPSPPPASNRLAAAAFTALLREAGLPPRTEILLGSTGASLRPGLAPALAAQLVFAARKEP
jgi:SAM-dependent methyltransferase